MHVLCGRPVSSALRRMVQTRSSSARATRRDAASAAPAAAAVEWDDVHNFRDVADTDPMILPGRIFRAAAPVLATAPDIRRLYGELGVKELIDLRSTDELRTMPQEHFAVFDGISFCKYVRDYVTMRSVPDPLSTQITDSDVMRVHIAPLEKRRLYRTLLGRMPLRTAAYVVATSIVNKEAGRAAAINEVNAEGLEGLYEILLDTAKLEWVAALQRILAAAEKQRPVLFFCKAGKDRTGILAALLLSVLGASEEQIVADYVKSDAWHHVALAGIENDSRVAALDRAKFERAPAAAMRHALAHLRETAGGPEAYLLSAGLTAEELRRLRAALLRPGAPGGPPAGGAGAAKL
ncbi:MAG: protein-tyrosine phosphatase-like protein [Monoraphidium minutum]|nr:MAG: protein-tyrosine phosphatase-like protein [Monoraphidium minutum]